MNDSATETSLGADISRYIRHQLRGRRGLIVAAVALVAPALWFGWPWLVMAGIAPVLVALAPCAVMCALGLCAMKTRSATGGSEAGCCSRSDESVIAIEASPDSTGKTDKVINDEKEKLQ